MKGLMRVLLNRSNTIRRLYSEIQGLRSFPENHARLAFKKRWAIWLITSCSFIVSNATIAAMFPIGSGFTPMGSASGSATVPNGTMGTTVYTIVASGFNLRPEAVNNTAFNCYNGITPTTIGGYTGFRVAQGILLVVYSGSATSTVYQTSTNTVVTGTWNSIGQYSSTPKPDASTLWCGNSGITTQFSTQQLGSKATASFKWGLYIGPTAVKGTYTIPPLLLIKSAGSPGTTGSNVLVPASTIQVTDTTCNIITAATVPFGIVTSNKPYIVPQSISLLCQGGNTPVNVSYRVTSKSGTATSTTLPMNNTVSKNKVGDVRGFLGDSAIADAGCLDKTSSMKMNGSSTLLKTGAAQSSTYSIPLYWVLCPTPNPDSGPASAALSLDFTW